MHSENNVFRSFCRLRVCFGFPSGGREDFSRRAGGPSPPRPIRDFSRLTRRDSGPLGAERHGREKSRGLWGSPTARAGNPYRKKPEEFKDRREKVECGLVLDVWKIGRK